MSLQKKLDVVNTKCMIPDALHREIRVMLAQRNISWQDMVKNLLLDELARFTGHPWIPPTDEHAVAEDTIKR